MKVQYLEIVTSDVESICNMYTRVHGAEFGDSDMSLGGARTAKLSNGGVVGVRGPLRETEHR